MSQVNFQTPGQVLSAGDTREMFLKLFPGEVMAAFKRSAVMEGRHRIHSVSSGKSYTFPAIGRAAAQYLQPGDNLDDQRIKIEHNERVIVMDTTLTAETFITDIYEALNHFEVRSEYAYQLGEALAIANDGAVLANIFNAYNEPENIPTKGSVEGTGTASNIPIGMAAIGVDKAVGEALFQALGEAKVDLDERHVPASQRCFMTTPAAYASLVMAQMPFMAQFPLLANQSMGTMSGFHGFEIIPVPHLLNGGAQGKHQVASNILAANPIGVAYHYTAVGTVRNKNITTEMGRRINFLSDQVVAYSLMGHGILRPESVVVISETAI